MRKKTGRLVTADTSLAQRGIGAASAFTVAYSHEPIREGCSGAQCRRPLRGRSKCMRAV